MLFLYIKKHFLVEVKLKYTIMDTLELHKPKLVLLAFLFKINMSQIAIVKRVFIVEKFKNKEITRN